MVVSSIFFRLPSCVYTSPHAHLLSPFPFTLSLTLAYAVKQAQPTASTPFEQHRLGTLLAYRSPATAIDPSASDRLYLRTASALRQGRRAANM